MPANGATFTQEDANFNKEGTAGYGDAVLLKPIANGNAIDYILRAKAAEKAARAKAGQDKSKLRQKTGKEFYDNLAEIQKKIHPSDIGFFQGKIGEMLDWAKEQNKLGQDPLDVESPVYGEMVKKLSDLGTMAGASYSQYQSKLKTNLAAEAKPDDYDLDQTYKKNLELDNIADPIKRASTGDYSAVKKPFNAQQYLNNPNPKLGLGVTPTILKDIATNVKQATTVDQQKENQKQLDGIKQRYTPFIDAGLFATGKYDAPDDPKLIADRDAYMTQFDGLTSKLNEIPKMKLDQQAGQFKKRMTLAWWVATHKDAIDQKKLELYGKQVDAATSVQDYGTKDLIAGLAMNTPEADQVFVNEMASSANILGYGDQVKATRNGKALSLTYPILDTNGNVTRTASVEVRDKNGKFNPEALASTSLIKIYEMGQAKRKTSPAYDIQPDDENENIAGGAKTSKSKSTVTKNTATIKKSEPLVVKGKVR